jgi:hypothetical protein
MTVEIAFQLMHCRTSQQLWKGASDLARAHTKSRVTLFKSEFQRTRKENLKMEEYLLKMKGIADNLTLAESPASDFDLMTQVLARLDSDYNPIVVQLVDKETLTWVDLQSTLLTYENRLEQLNSFSSLTLENPVANISQKSDQKPSNSDKGNWKGNNGRGGRVGRSRGSGGRFQNNRTNYQLCGKGGHIAIKYFYRFDQNFTPNTIPLKTEVDIFIPLLLCLCQHCCLLRLTSDREGSFMVL